MPYTQNCVSQPIRGQRAPTTKIEVDSSTSEAYITFYAKMTLNLILKGALEKFPREHSWFQKQWLGITGKEVSQDYVTFFKICGIRWLLFLHITIYVEHMIQLILWPHYRVRISSLQLCKLHGDIPKEPGLQPQIYCYE